ncbi:hypothetical protein [Pseudomonas sp. S2_H01]
MPTVDAAIDDFDGLVPIDALGDDLVLHMVNWSGSVKDYTLQLAFKVISLEDPNEPDEEDFVGVKHTITQQEAENPDTIFEFLIPQILLTHGDYLARCYVESPVGSNSDWSPSAKIRIDTTAPGGGGFPPLIFDLITQGVIVDDDLKDDKLLVRLPHYEGIARGDTIRLYVGAGNDPVYELYLENEIIENPLGWLQVYYPKAALESVGNGDRFFQYQVTDKAGNAAESFVQALRIKLGTAPINLRKPNVPAADGNVLLDAEARPFTKVEIPKYDNALPGDEILVHWGNSTPLNNVKLTSADLQNDPFVTIDLPYALVQGETVKGNVDVTFEIFRENVSEATSPVNSVTVDLTLPGGPDPDPETPELDSLAPLVVRSPNSSTDNVIPAEDADADATVTIPWLDKNGKTIYQANDVITVTWGSQTGSTETYTVVALDITNETIPPITIPNKTIKDENASADIPVGYTITRTISGGTGDNVSLAFPTKVQVINPTELPGGGTLLPVTFTVLNARGNIGLAQIVGSGNDRHNPITTKVNYDKVDTGDKLELFFTGYDEFAGGNIAPGSEYSETVLLSATDIAKGTHEFKVPAVHHFSICIGRCEAFVKITNSQGFTVSPIKGVLVDVKNVGDGDCSANLP